MRATSADRNPKHVGERASVKCVQPRAPSEPNGEAIRRTPDTQPAPVQDKRVDHGGAHVPVDGWRDSMASTA
jgi:hypothetical protein